MRDNVIYKETWQAKRQRESDFTDEDPVVLIIGGGHSGLELAARLKMLDVPSLIIEQLPRVGDTVSFVFTRSELLVHFSFLNSGVIDTNPYGYTTQSVRCSIQ